MKLVLANKRYSSWSLRVWLAMKHFGLAFDEQVISLRRPDTHAKIDRILKGAKLPILADGPVKISESLAILEYLAEKHPGKSWWPKSRTDRAYARSIAHEMHGGFMGLRSTCPMNCFAGPLKAIPEEAKPDAERIRAIWRACLSRGRKGGFLFGAFTIVDAMYAPVVIRFTTYGFKLEPALQAYSNRILELPAMRQWFEAARAETERISAYEI